MKRNSGLDIARSIAILAVLVHHLILYNLHLLNFNIPPTHMLMGWFGVDIFFVLSGFLIGRILIKTFFTENNRVLQNSRGMLMNFYKRRWFRTLPLYYLMLFINIVLFLVVTMDLNYWLDLKKFLPHLSFTHYITMFWDESLSYMGKYHFMGESWSLCIEEFFYLFFPLIILLFVFLNKDIKKARTRFLYFVIFSILALILIKTAGIIFLDYSTGFVHYFTLFRLEGLLVGFLLAYIYSEHRHIYMKLTTKRSLFISLTMLGFLIFYLSNPQYTQEKYWNDDLFSKAFSYTYLAVVWANLIAFLENLKIKNIAFFEFTSKISYSMYLIHNVVLIFLSTHIFTLVTDLTLLLDIKSGNLLNLALYNLVILAVVYGISAALYKFFEEPVMNLRDKF